MEEPITLLTCIGVLAGIINILKQALPEKVHRFIPITAVVVGGLSGLAIGLLTGPVTVMVVGTYGMKGLIVGLSATGAYETVKTHG